LNIQRNALMLGILVVLRPYRRYCRPCAGRRSPHRRNLLHSPRLAGQLAAFDSGWLHGGLVDGAVNGRDGYRKLPEQPLRYG
jgi:hypothetical protein